MTILKIPTISRFVICCGRCDDMADDRRLLQVIIVVIRIVICLRSLLEYRPQEAGDVLLLGLHNNITAARAKLASIRQHGWPVRNIFIDASRAALRLC